jgi:hypothetical protein
LRNVWRDLFVGMVVTLLLLTMTPLTGAEIGTGETQILFIPPEDSETIIIYRFGPYGRITTVPYDIGQAVTTDVSEKVMEICKELLKTDEEIQQFVNTKSALHFKVESKGRGFHFAAFRPMLRFLPVLRSYIYYRYVCFNNEDAYTKADNQTLAQGPHIGSIIGFIGYAGFSTRIFGRTVIYGYSLFRINVKSIN